MMLTRGIGDAAADAAISKWRTSLGGKASELRAKYAPGKPVVAVELLEDVDHWWQVATEFSKGAASLNQITDAQIRQAQRNAIDLLETRGYLKTLYFGQVIEPELVYTAVEQMIQPIDWLIAIGGPALQTSADYTDMVAKATDLPSLSLNYLMEQLVKAFALPSWTVPVVGAAAIGGLGLWAYFTFLKPVSRTMRYANPRRRRRR